MILFDRCVELLKRNSKKVVISACVLSGAMIGVHYLKKYSIEWQYNKIYDFLKETHRKDQFQIIESLTRRLAFECSNYVKVNLDRFFKERNNLLPRNDIEFNKDKFLDSVKMNLFINVFLMMYSSTLFVITIKMYQYVFRGNCINSSNKISNNFKEKFTITYNNILINAIKRINKNLETNLKKHLTKFDIYQEYQLKDIELLIYELHSELTNICKPFEYFIQEMHKEFEEDFQDPFNNIIISEIKDLLRSEEVEMLFNSCIRISDSVFIDEFFELFILEDGKSTSLKKVFINYDKSIILFKLLPKIDSMLQNNQFFNNLISQLLNSRNLKVLENNVMESYYHN